MSTYTEPPEVNGHRVDTDIVREALDALKDTGERRVPEAPSAAWRDWIMVGVGLSGLLSVIAIIVAVFALASKNPSRASVAPTVAATPVAAVPVTPAVAPQSLTIAVKADSEHGRLGPDGAWHDAFLPADFSVRPGATVTITIENYDSGPHSFTSPAMGVNTIIPGGGTPTTPARVTFTFKAPTRPGRYAWWCAVPCDPWAMAHDGYMRGFVTVKA